MRDNREYPVMYLGLQTYKYYMDSIFKCLTQYHKLSTANEDDVSLIFKKLE